MAWLPVHRSLKAIAGSHDYDDAIRALALEDKSIDQIYANLIQAQRDYFDAHTDERVDEKGMFHTQWEKE